MALDLLRDTQMLYNGNDLLAPGRTRPDTDAGLATHISSRRINRMKKITALALGLVLVAGTTFASNTGFKLNYTLKKPGSVSGNNWFSLPYFYFPDGNVNNTNQNFIDLCNDINEGVKSSKVGQVFFYDTVNDRPVLFSCNSTLNPHKLIAGEGYSFVPKTDGLTINIVGSHDDAMAKNKVVSPATPVLYNLRKPGTTTGNNWFSVPYHSKADNLLDLCNDINDGVKSSKVRQVFAFDTTNDRAVLFSCNSTLNPRLIVAGEGYNLIPAADNTGISVSVY